MSKKTKVNAQCDNCGKDIEVKLSRFNRFKKHYCSNFCRYAGRTADIDKNKEKILSMYRNGKNILEIAKELELEYERLCYHFKKWKIDVRKCYHYSQIMTHIGLQKRKKTEKDFIKRYQNGEISWRHTHSIAERIWNITEKPCEVCGWEEAERDMHLIIPRKLTKENAVSLCPNHHRLFHRGKIKLYRKNKKLIVVKI